MKQILDLHIHSKYSRACSGQLTLGNIDKTCRIKGIDIIATGDFTYPAWFSSIKNELEEIQLSPVSTSNGQKSTPPFVKGGAMVLPPYEGGIKGGSGLYRLKSAPDDKIKFILSTELALIYKKGDRARRIHIVVHAPCLEAVEELNKFLGAHYNIKSDGRPILGMSAETLMELCLKIHPKFLIYPAHIWTPWFSVFGSKSGFNTMEECFGDWAEHIYAIETGLSSDPEMNWRLSILDKYTVLSNSDAHSTANLAREANIMDLDENKYDEIYEVIKNKDLNKLKGTIEFYPEEGMYHFDGHRACGISFTPTESKKHHNICPVCKKPLVIGVLNRVEELADRPSFAKATAGKPEGFRPENAAPFIKLVELDKIIAESMGIKSRTSKQVQAEYSRLVTQAGTEMEILMDKDLEELKKITTSNIVEGIRRVRAGELTIKPGFDGQYGEVRIFSSQEVRQSKQSSLF